MGLTAAANESRTATVVRMDRYPKYKTESEAPRPFGIWNEMKKEAVPHRHYRSPRKAHDGAYLEARWIPMGHVLTVWDKRTGRELGQYKHSTDSKGRAFVLFLRLLKLNVTDPAEPTK